MELDKIKENEMKEKIKRECKRTLMLILKSKLEGRNKITAINTWAVAIFRYGAGLIDWKCGGAVAQGGTSGEITDIIG